MGKKESMKEIRELSADDLQARELSLTEQIMRDRLGRATDPSKDAHSSKEAKRKLAQVLTQKSLLKGASVA